MFDFFVLRRASAAWAMLSLLAVSACGEDAPNASLPARAPDGVASRVPATAGPSPDGIALADAHASAVRTPSAADAWGGPRTGNEATLSDRVVEYVIDATLDPKAHTVTGRERLTWRNRSDREVRAVYLHLYLNAFEGDGSTFMTEKRRSGAGFRSDVELEAGEEGSIELRKVEQAGLPVPLQFVHPDHGPDSDRTVVRLDLPTAVAAGANTTLDIDFLDRLPRVVARTGHFGSFHLVAQWFPKIGVLELPGERGTSEPRWNVHELHLHSEFYADFGSYDVRLTVPAGFVVGATGAEVEAPKVQGALVTHHFAQGDVHDFAWTADNRTAPPLQGVFRRADGSDVQIRVLFPPEYTHNAQPVLDATLSSLHWFSETLGPYPYPTVTVVIPPFNADEAGGMEYPTFFTAESFEDVTPGTLAAYALDFVTVHEFGHGYFYGILASNEFEEPMLDEGLNEYWDLRLMRRRDERVGLSMAWMHALGFAPSIAAFDVERFASVRGQPADGLGANSWDRHSSNSYGSVYSRTATMMDDLEQRLGQAVLERAMKSYYERWKFRHPSVADFRESLAESSRKRSVVDELFEQQVYAGFEIDDRVEGLSSSEEVPLTVSSQRGLTAAQRELAIEKGRPYPYRSTVTLGRYGADAPRTLVVRFSDGSQEKVLWNDSRRWRRYSWVKPVRAVSAQFEPQGAVPLDSNRLDDSYRARSDRRPAARVVSDASQVLEILFALVATL